MVNMKRIVLYLLGMLVLALGNVLFVRSGLGGSAVVAVPYTLAVDFYDFVLHIYPQHIVLKICCLLVAVSFTAIGIFIIINGKFIVNPPDGIVQAISKITGKEFGKVKFLFDIAMVILTMLIGIICRGEIIGIGIGTVLAVFSIGNIIRILDRRFNKVKE